MFLLRKFYDIAEGENSGGGEAAIAEPPRQTIASILAAQGKKTEGLDPVGVPEAIIPEKKEEPKADPKSEKIEDTSADASKTEQAKPEVPKPEKTEAEVKPEPQKAEAETAKVQTWQEVLTSQQPDLNEVLKVAGFDDKIIGILQELDGFDKVEYFTNLLSEWKKGNLNSYVKELSTDYAKMSAEEVMKHQLREEYPKSSEKQLEILFKKKVIEAYSLDNEDEDLREEGKLLLDAEADKYRDSLVERQKKSLAPAPPEARKPEPDKEQELADQNFEAYKSKIESDPYIKDIVTSNKITFGEGEEALTFPVTGKDIQALIYDNAKFAEAVSNKVVNKDGTISYSPDIKKQTLIAAVALYGDKFLDKLATHYKGLGGKAVTDSIENAKPADSVTTSTAKAEITDPAKAMASGGKIVTGGNYQQ